MHHRFLPASAVLAVCLMSVPAWARQEPSPAPASTPLAVQAESAAALEAAPEKILVPGQRPGPGLWKVSKGEHVLWLFGTYSPLPQKMEWRSHEVETVIAQSQEYLKEPSASSKIGFFRQLTLLPYAIGLKKNPDGAQLRDLVPADVYQRWLPLKAKYIGKDEGIEFERPIFAAETLYKKRLEFAGLTSGREVLKAIEAVVKKHKLKTTSPEVKLALDNPVAMIKDFKKSSLDDVACFTSILARLETDISALLVRANAWAKGDVEAIRALDLGHEQVSCFDAMSNSNFVKGQPSLQNMRQRMDDAWLAAAEKSLATNASTFGVLPLRNILDPKGVLSALQARGYTLTSPD